MATPKTLLQIVQAAQAELGLTQSTSVVGNTSDLIAVQMLALANESGEEIRDAVDGGWSSMQIEFNLVVNTPISTTGNTTVNSPVVTNIQPNTTGLVANNFMAVGSAIPQAARIKSVDSSSQVTLTMNATGASTSEPILFCQDTYPLPSDYKFSQNRSHWDRTNHWELLGPDSPQMDQWHRSGIVATGPRRHWRNLGHAANTWRLWPQPAEITSPIQLSFEYVSTDWVNVGGTNTTTASSFQGDTDMTYIDDRLLIKFIKWKYWQIKGFAFETMRNDAIDFMKTLIARDTAGAPTLHLSKRVHSMFLSPNQIIDGNFPGPIGSNTN